MSHIQRHRGFTLIELMIAIAVAAILLAIAIPSFQSLTNSSRLNSITSALQADLNLARTEALRRGQRIAVCPSTAPYDACDGNDFATGWIVYQDTNRNRSVDVGEEILRVQQAVPAGMTMANNLPLANSSNFAFAPSGMAALAGGSVRVCLPTTSPAENVRQVIVDGVSGHIRSTPLNAAGVCP